MTAPRPRAASKLPSADQRRAVPQTNAVQSSLSRSEEGERSVAPLSRSEEGGRSEAGESCVVELRSDSPEETQRLGEVLGNLLLVGDVVLLHGALGAGKTAFTQGIGHGLGVAGPINSPTFTLLKEYAGRLPLYHFDLYRIEDPAEVEELGFAHYFEGDGVCVVEWAERGESADADGAPWPDHWLRVSLIRTGEHARLLRCVAYGPRGQALLNAFAAIESGVA